MLNGIVPIRGEKIVRSGFIDINRLVNDYEWNMKGFALGPLVLLIRPDY